MYLFLKLRSDEYSVNHCCFQRETIISQKELSRREAFLAKPFYAYLKILQIHVVTALLRVDQLFLQNLSPERAFYNDFF